MDKDKLAGDLANKYEGTRLFPYTDTVGKLTIGVGHNLTDKGLTPNQVAKILYDDIDDTIKLLDSKLSWWKNLDEVRQRALANMTFNLMDKIMDFKQLIIALQGRDWDAASNSVLQSKFATQVGKRAVDIAYMFKTGLDPK